MSRRKNNPKRRHRMRLRWWRVITILVIVGVVLPLAGIGWGAYRAEATIRTLKSDYHAHNFVAMAASVQKLGDTMGMIRDSALLLGWLDVLPYIRGYYLNVMDLLTAGYQELHAIGQVLPPVMEAIDGAHGQSASASQVRAAVRAAGLTMSRLEPELLAANRTLQRLNPYRMPGFLQNRGLDVAAIKSASSLFVRFLPTMTGAHPVLASILGMPSPVRYLMVFQNSGELRATGGFMTAYAYLPLHNAHIGHITSQNIEMLDERVTYQPTPPMIIGLFLPVTYWHLRDANSAVGGISGAPMPDVPEAVHNIYQFYDSIPGAPPVNGVIFVDTWFVDELIGDVGGLNVPTLRGKVVHLTEQNANYEMEYMSEGEALPTNLRKLFIGTMMKELMHEVFHGHTSELVKVAGTIGQALDHENIMLYFNNPKAEQFVVRENWGGVIPRNVNGDFVEVIDENLLGHKDNYWMHEWYDVNITSEKGGNLETVTIHWLDPALVQQVPPYLTVPYQSWVTVFAPPGSSLVSMTGVASGGDNEPPMGIDSYVQESYDPTLNKEEYGAHLSLPGRMTTSEPPATATVVVKFWLPSNVNIHHILVQKQPGMRTESVTVTVNGVTRHIALSSRTWVNL